MPSSRVRALAACLTLVAMIACGPAGPGGPGAETLAAFTLTVDPQPGAYAPTTLTITAVGSAGSAPLSTFGGAVALELEEGGATPASVTLVGGTATVQVTLTGTIGVPLALTARAGTVSGTAVLELGPIAVLPGDPTAAAADALPFLPFRPRDDDYASDAPDLPGLDLSFNTVTALFAPDVTVGDLNALLARHGAGVVAFAPGDGAARGAVAALRLPTLDHAAMLAALDGLDAEPAVVVVHREHAYPDPERLDEVAAGAVGRSAVTGGGPGTLPGWAWELGTPSPDANWHFERTRVPQLWNLNGLARATANQAGVPRVAVLDLEFVASPDVPMVFDANVAPSTNPAEYHGLMVASIVGARWGNGVGTDGVHPFADLVAFQAGKGPGWRLFELLERYPDVAIVNVSLGSNWYLRTPVKDPTTNAAEQKQIRREGELIWALLSTGARAPGVLIVTAAGNDSGWGKFAAPDLIEARWNSGLAYAALGYGAQNVLVVGAMAQDADGGNLRRSFYSNLGAHVAAPADAIGTADPTAAGASIVALGGTSSASPLVAGIAAYLRTLDPDLTPAQLIDLLVSTAAPVPGSAPMVDAFAAALAIDTLRGDRRILRALVDIDDGTLDGNTRIDPFTGEEVAHTEGRFGPTGDGRVDMRDFRRFRDALIVAVDGAFLLDGRNDHPKNDLNLDGPVGDGASENVFPRADFNGDGRVTDAAAPDDARVPGFPADVADLALLQAVWDDPDVFAHELPGLLDSGDLHLDAQEAFEDARVDAIEVEFRDEAETALRTVRLLRDRARQVVTLPVGVYEAVIRLTDAAGELLDERTEPFALEWGGDVAIRVGPAPSDFGDVVAAGAVHALAVRADGTVVTWGLAPPGVGTGDRVTHVTPVVVPGLEDVRSVAAGLGTSYAVRRDGTLWVWGGNCSGSLGLGATESVGPPTQVPGLQGVVAVSASGCSALALLDDGRVLRWGALWATNYGAVPTVVPSLSGIRSISAGSETAFAVDASGAVFGWGRNDFGQLAFAPFEHQSEPVPASLPTASEVHGGVVHAVARLADGTVAAWGYGEAAGVPGVFVAVPPTPIPVGDDVVAVDVGNLTSFAVARDGSLSAWGSNRDGALGIGAPTNDGSFFAPFLHPTLTDVARVAATHEEFTLFVRRDGTVWSVGRNDFGQLGDGTTTDRFAPVQVVGLTVP